MVLLNKYKIIYIFLIIILSYWSIRPLLNPGFFPMHDDTQPSRVQQMAKALNFGQFPVRWVPDLGYGYGYPIFNFYAPFPYYVGSLFNLLGFDIITATKMMFLIGILISGIFMFLLVSHIAGDLAGIVSAVLYVYAPYHAVNIYVRGAVGEYYAYGFLPLVLLGIIRRNILLTSLGLGAVLVSHNILGLITLYFLLIFLLVSLFYILLKKQRLFTIYYLLFTILFGIGLSSFFTIPALAEREYTRVTELTGGGSDFRSHFVYLDQLWQSDWGYAGSSRGREDGMSFKIGKLHVILGIFSIIVSVYLYKNRKIKKKKFVIYLLCFVGLILSTFLTLESSRFFWEVLPYFSYIQYPWRFLNLVVFFLSIISSSIFLQIGRRVSLLLGFFIIPAILFLNIKYFQPNYYKEARETDYISQESLNFSISKISDEYLPKDFKLPSNKNETEFIVKTYEDKPTQKVFLVDTLTTNRQVFNITYFPGWQVFIDGQTTEIESTDGRITVNIPQGTHIVSLKFSDTFIRKLANTISLFSVILLVYSSLWQLKNKA